ncbi:hypothetical protein J416_14046 [Gracilibacillus halophilus YIM-C55.5]|uniref:Uncharacterized protein n=1 Tax=Gracilibacillus halophilus YIM-C55.5 TaxID=1308866 RepID=N4WMU5_9BACI|nr:hypothetical protein [Gracilibacillus halophilus]ENH95840.1 hypothetical protein J416_14046 [Gracilibacillus halophilus YIM-C55.5]
MKKTSLLFSFLSGFFILLFLLFFGSILYAVIGYELEWRSFDVDLFGIDILIVEISDGEGFSFTAGIGLFMVALIGGLLNMILTKVIKTRTISKS